MPQLDAISSSSVCRVLVISRAAYQSIERAFPAACRNVWTALQRVAEATLDQEFAGHMKTQVCGVGRRQGPGGRGTWAGSSPDI